MEREMEVWKKSTDEGKLIAAGGRKKS